MREFAEREYRPEYGTFLLRDTDARGLPRVPVGAALDEGATGTPPGSPARAGNGWVDGQAADRTYVVRLEAHDAPPPAEEPGWPDVVESPPATTGTLGPATVTGGPAPAGLRLGPPGLYRMRLHRRPGEYRRGGSGGPMLREGGSARGTGGGRAMLRHAAGDLALLLVWAGEAGLRTDPRTDPDWVADRLLCTPDEARKVLSGAGL